MIHVEWSHGRKKYTEEAFDICSHDQNILFQRYRNFKRFKKNEVITAAWDVSHGVLTPRSTIRFEVRRALNYTAEKPNRIENKTLQYIQQKNRDTRLSISTARTVLADNTKTQNYGFKESPGIRLPYR